MLTEDSHPGAHDTTPQEDPRSCCTIFLRHRNRDFEDIHPVALRHRTPASIVCRPKSKDDIHIRQTVSEGLGGSWVTVEPSKRLIQAKAKRRFGKLAATIKGYDQSKKIWQDGRGVRSSTQRNNNYVWKHLVRKPGFAVANAETQDQI